MPPAFWSNQREYDELREQILAAVERVFSSGQLILGSEVMAFERAMAADVGVAGGVEVNSGTDALLCRETARGVEFLLRAKADSGNIEYLQFCPTIQSMWSTIRGFGNGRRVAFAECPQPLGQCSRGLLAASQ